MSQDSANIYAAPQSAYEDKPGENTSGMGNLYPVPPEASGWSWGAFSLNWIWAIGNRTWIGLLALVPYLGFIVAIILGVKGREWAWQNKRWDSIEHFNRVQRRWSIWGACLLLIPVLGIMAAVAIPAYSDYNSRSVNTIAYMHAQRAASHVGAYIINHHSLPGNLADAGVTEAAPAGVRSVALNQKTAQLEITMDRSSVAGKTFYLAPDIDKDGYVTWTCLPGDIRPALLPKDCR
jgi:Tfp pilus assembly major pilin PilA